MSAVTSKEGFVVDLTSSELYGKGHQSISKTDWFQVMRLELPQGQSIPAHQAKGPITVQCLSGCVHFFVDESPQELKQGCWLFLNPETEHSLLAMEDSVVLVTKLNHQ